MPTTTGAPAKQDLFTRAQGRVSEISRRALEQVVNQVDFYGRLPADIVDGELASYMMANVRLYLRLLRDERLPSAEDMAGPVSAGVRRAQEGVPLSAMLAAYLAATRAAMSELEEMAGPDDQGDLVLAGKHALLYLEHLLPLVSEVYLDEHRAMYGEEQELRRTVTAALISGQPADELAARARVTLVEAYVVIALSLPKVDAQPAAESAGRGSVLTGDIADRRRVRALRELLAERLGERVLTTLGPEGGLVLVPLPDLEETPRAAAEVLTDVLSKSLEGDVFTGLVSDAARGGIPAAAEQAGELAALGRLLGRAPGVFELEDVLTEYQLTRPGPARTALATKVGPLVDHPHLLETLVAFLRHHNNGKAAADALHVHTNTLHYRLRRVSEITGLDPAHPVDLRVLAAALVADRVEREH